MSKNTELAERKTEQVQQLPPTDLLTAIAHAVTDPRIDVEKMERLLAMHERITAEQRKTAFFKALSELQAEIPQVSKGGQIQIAGETRSRYAMIEDIDTVLRPLMDKHGFAFSFDEDATDGKIFKLSCRMSHREGHSETKCISLPLDTSGSKNSVQARGSTQTYGQRYLIGMHVNLVTRGQDTDAHNPETITAEQADAIEQAIIALPMNRVKFLAYMGAGDVSQILARDWKKAQNAIDTQRQAIEKKKQQGGPRI